MAIATVTLYLGEEEYIVNVQDVDKYIKAGLTKRKKAKKETGEGTGAPSTEA